MEASSDGKLFQVSQNSAIDADGDPPDIQAHPHPRAQHWARRPHHRHDLPRQQAHPYADRQRPGLGLRRQRRRAVRGRGDED